MKDIIKKILSEEKQKVNLTSTISSMGLFSFLETVDISYNDIVSIYGDGFLSKDVIIKFIKDYLTDEHNGKYGAMSISPLMFNLGDDKMESIGFITNEYVVVTTYKTDEGYMDEIDKSYYRYQNIDLGVLREIFDKCMKEYLKK